ncbi:UNVERIFIED_CONTAM: hypothetical protein Sradi_1466400 [Sesamum radiatum]|uniref:Uncharacterized protein n=1 Tax=Sesamum radiatum TaxID=300843 RepID=A0AAW2U6V0_SESRA
MDFAALFCLVLVGIQVSKSVALIATQDSNPPYPKAISDLKEAIVKGLGFQADDVKISGFDLRDAQVGKSVAYEFDVEIDNKVLPFKLLEDVNRWEYVDLPIFQMEPPAKPGEENGLVERKNLDDQMPVLAPFQLAGPMELWIQDAKNMRISLPHECGCWCTEESGFSRWCVVTVKAILCNQKESLESDTPYQQLVTKEKPLHFLHLIKHTVACYIHSWFKLKPAWFETLLSSLLGPKANKEGFFKLLKAMFSSDVCKDRIMVLRRRSKKAMALIVKGFPEWRTKPKTVRHFEVHWLSRCNKVVPEKVVQIDPVMAEDSVAPNMLGATSHVTGSPIVYQPPSPLTL